VGTGSDIIQGNLIGTDPTGELARPNTGDGLLIGSPGNTIGGTSVSARNVISGNGGSGLTLASAQNVVQGNFIGVTASGAALGNAVFGVSIAGAGNNTIGGPNAAIRNVISNNHGGGIAITSSSGPGNLVQGNWIGVGIDGVTPMGNTSGGVELIDAAQTQVLGNIIANNSGAGVLVVTATANSAGNRISQNSIYNNQTLGIDLAGDGPTANDALDADTGPNDLVNFPVLDSASAPSPGRVQVVGEYHGAPSATFTIELFTNASADSSGFGQGRVFETSGSITTDSNGDATFSLSFNDSTPNLVLSATATDSAGNTSEFSHVLGSVAPEITAVGNGISGTAGVPLSNFVVARFTDTDPSFTASDFTATIDWGDDSSDAGVVQAGNGAFEVFGSHVYDEPGDYSVTVFVGRDEEASATAQTTAAISLPSTITLNAINVVAVEGLSAGAVRVATFTDESPGEGTSYDAHIDWGDGHASNGTVARNSDGSYTVRGKHVYKLAGSHPVNVLITSSDSRKAHATSSVRIVNAVRIATPLAIQPVARRVAGPVLAFFDTNSFAVAHDYSASINWGDGKHSTGHVRGRSGLFEVDSTHVYRKPGHYQVVIRTTDSVGETIISRQEVVVA
jgi:hypothetical protein